MLNLLPVAVYVCDLSGAIVKYNEEAARLWERHPVIGDKEGYFYSAFKLYNPDGSRLPHNETPAALSLKDGKPQRDVEMILERSDLSRIYVKVNTTPFKDEKGQLTGIIVCFFDITEQKKATEATLKEGVSRYRKLIQNLPTPLYTTDTEGRITLYNKAAVELWGREPEVGKELWCGSYKIIRQDGTELPLNECPMAICLKEQQPVKGREILVMRPDGSLRNVVVHPQPLFDDNGKMTGAINMLVDITAVKKVEEALRKSEARYRRLTATLEKKVEEKTYDLQVKTEELKKSEERYHKMIEEVEDYAIILLDKDGIIQNWNKGAEKIKGYKEEEIVGRSFSNFYLPEDREKGLHKKLLELARETGKALHEGWRMRKDGSAFWGSIVLTALHDNEGNVIGFSKVTRDLTERKLAEDKMLEYTSQLELQNKELEEFSYAASHDMKEPLRKIIFYNSHLWDNITDKLSDKEKDYLGRSINAAKRMKSLIDDLLEYSRATMIRQDFEPVDLNEIVDEVILSYKEAIEQSGVTVLFTPLPVIQGIPFQLRQLFDNLLSNSLKYHHPDRKLEVQIRVTQTTGADIEGLKKQTKYYRITFSDNGSGFDPAYAEKIFELFQRLDPGKCSGTGVGLALCKKIVQNHHGAITAWGDVNGGARFDIYFPC